MKNLLLRRRSWQEIALLLMAFVLLVLAVVHLTNAVTTVARYTLNHVFQDQFRLNLRYLTVPFPLSIFELENGHRPVLPGLARWLELRYLAGATTIEFVSAWVSAAVAVVLVFVRCWSALDGPRRVMLLCATATTVLWIANARMFIHAYEATHLFYIFGSLVVALYALSDERDVTWSRVATACLAATFATFTFGPGIIVFGAVALLLVLRRVPWPMLATAVAAAGLVFAVYSFALPGSAGVRASSESVSLVQTSYFVVARMAAFWVELFALSSASHSWQRSGIVLISAVVIASTLLHAFRLWLTRQRLSPAMLMGLGILSFSVVTNALIAINRTGHFQSIPEELFADRYLFWSALLWLGLATYWLSVPQRSRNLSLIMALIIALEAGLAFGQGNWWRSWASSTYRVVELTSVAMQRSIAHDHRLQEVSGLDIPQVQASVDVMRKARVSTFARDPGAWLGRSLVLSASAVELPVAISVDTKDLPKNSPWEILGGVMPRFDAHRLSGRELWVANEGGTVIGQRAKTGLRTKSTDYSRYFKPIYNQFDCYVQRGHNDKLILVATRGETAQTVAKLQPIVRDTAFIPSK